MALNFSPYFCTPKRHEINLSVIMKDRDILNLPQVLMHRKYIHVIQVAYALTFN